MRLLLPSLLIAIAAVFAACAEASAPSGQVSTSTEIPPTSTPTIAPTPTIGAGQDQSLQGELVPDFPADFPVPDGAQVVQSSRTTDASGLVSISAHFQVQLTPREAGDFYSQAFAGAPWALQLEQVEDDSAFFQFSNSNDAEQNGFVSIAPTEDDVGVVIQVLLGSGQPATPTPTPEGTPDGESEDEATSTPTPAP